MTAPCDGVDAAPEGEEQAAAARVRVVRDLMRQGLSDEEIQTRTGLSLLEILAVRAGVSVAPGANRSRGVRGDT